MDPILREYLPILILLALAVGLGLVLMLAAAVLDLTLAVVAEPLFMGGLRHQTMLLLVLELLDLTVAQRIMELLLQMVAADQ